MDKTFRGLMRAERRSGVDDRKYTFESLRELPGSDVGDIDALEFGAVRGVAFLKGRDFGAAGGTGQHAGLAGNGRDAACVLPSDMVAFGQELADNVQAEEASGSSDLDEIKYCLAPDNSGTHKDDLRRHYCKGVEMIKEMKDLFVGILEPAPPLF